MGIKMDMVYVVEPDDGIREAIQTFLESFDVPVQVFSDAIEFLNAAGTNAQGCVIAEAELPGLDGLGLLKHLRTRNNDAEPPSPFARFSQAIAPWNRRLFATCHNALGSCDFLLQYGSCRMRCWIASRIFTSRIIWPSSQQTAVA